MYTIAGLHDSLSLSLSPSVFLSHYKATGDNMTLRCHHLDTERDGAEIDYNRFITDVENKR